MSDEQIKTQVESIGGQSVSNLRVELNCVKCNQVLTGDDGSVQGHLVDGQLVMPCPACGYENRNELKLTVPAPDV